MENIAINATVFILISAEVVGLPVSNGISIIRGTIISEKDNLYVVSTQTDKGTFLFQVEKTYVTTKFQKVLEEINTKFNTPQQKGNGIHELSEQST